MTDIKNKVISASYLDGGKPISFVVKDGRLTLRNLNSPLEDPIATTIVLEVEGQPETTHKQTSFWIPG